MTAPFIASQTPFLTFLRELINRDKNGRFKLRFLSVITVSPLMIVFMFVMDIVFLLNQAFLYPIIAFLNVLTCEKLGLGKLLELIDKSYEILFDMQKLEVAGFRRMRTITQMLFETLIQLVLQVRMLIYFKRHYVENPGAVGVSVDDIFISIVLALSHAILEAIYLGLEA